MKLTQLYILLLPLAMLTGCSNAAPENPAGELSSHHANVAPSPSPTVTPDSKTGLIPAKDRASSKQFYLDVRVTDADTGQQTEDGRPLAYLSRANEQKPGYHASSSIPLTEARPGKIEISFPLPPEVALPEQASVHILLGCQSQGYDVYFMEASHDTPSFKTFDGVPRGRMTTQDENVKEVFSICGAEPVSMAICFVGSDEKLITYEYTSLVLNRPAQ